MNITRLSVTQPAAVLVLLALIVLFGSLSIFQLPIQLTPNIVQPQITIFSGWRSAAPEEVESVIIEPLENAVKITPGATDITTQIRRGGGSITLTFDIGTDMQKATLDVLNNLNRAPPLPLDAFEPVVFLGGGGGGAGSGSQTAASLLVLPLNTVGFEDIAQYQDAIEDIVEPRLARIPGVSRVNLQSLRQRELRVTFDPHKAAALGVSVSDISRTLASSRDVSGGFADVGRRQYTVRFTGQYDLKSLEDMRIAYSQNRPIYLRDIATVERTVADRGNFSLRNGKPSFYITLERSNSSNTVQVLDEINIAIEELNAGALAREQLKIELSFDASVHIRNAIDLVNSNLGLGVLLAGAILFFFFRGLGPTLIVMSTIPVSLMVAFLALSIFDRSLNVISLAGLAFSVGLVLDAAIIVLENITRLKNEGMEHKEAIVKGATQVSGALFTSTATSVAIFLPILFMEGIEGQLFSDLALTLSVAVLASFISAITIIPLAYKLILKQPIKPDPYASYWQRLTKLVMRLTHSIRLQIMWIVTLVGGSVAVTLLLLPDTDFMPRAPTDGFFYSLITPPGGNIEFMEEEIASRVIERISPLQDPALRNPNDTRPPISDYNFYVGGAFAGGFIYSEDPTRVEELMDVARNEIFHGLPDTQVFLFRGSMINVGNGGDGRTLSIDLRGSSIEELTRVARVGLEQVNKAFEGATARPQPSLDVAEPELRFHPNDRRISQAGLSRSDVASSIQAFTSGLFVSEFFDGNERMNVILRAEQWHTPEELIELPIVTPNSGIQTLGQLTSFERTVGPSQLRRVNGQRTVTIQVTPPADMSLETAQRILDEKVLPSIQQAATGDVSIVLSGNTKKLNSAIHDMSVNFLLAFFILFLLMTALFHSAKDSLIVLFIMPLAIAGGVLALAVLNLFTNQSLDLLTMIGFIILLGLVVNNAILLVDQTRRAEENGLNRREAVEQAVLIRARPVYLSTLTSLFGMLPLMLVPGVGSEIYRGLATVIVGGMLISAIFTLVLMPSLLRLQLNPKTEKFTNKSSAVL